MKINKGLLFSLLFGLLCISAYSQIRPGNINTLVSSLDSIRQKMPVEKVYIQTDKPYYTGGDTIWLKAYLFDAAYLKNSLRSGILYLELANDTGKVLDRRMLSLTYGVGQGNIVLNKEDIPEGSYTLRAYTNWMRNFGEDYVFKKSFYVSSMAADSWLVSSAIQSNFTAGKDSIRMALQFRQINGNAVGLKDLQLRLMDGKKTLFRNKFQTSAEGKLDLNFILPDKANAGNITLLAEDPAPPDAAQKGQENRKVPIPVPLNRPENTDLQFMPEGGNMVAGIPSKVGFKAISEDGKSVEIAGKIYTSSGTEVTSFASLHKGMGSFELTPEAGQNYTAKVSLPDGTTKSYPLPVVKSSGIVLGVTNTKESDSISLNISGSADLMNTSYYLTGQSRGVVCYAARITLNSKESLKKIPKSAFPTGVARFTLLNITNQPVNERIIFIDHQDNLRITINPDRSGYTSRDSIALAIEIKDKEGKPVRGSFSLAVTDDSQVKIDSTAANILLNLLLTSDLKGTVEDPGYYFQPDSETFRNLDNLLLTQGWVGYDPQDAVHWKDVFSSAKTPEYEAEPEFMVRGRVRNITNKSLKGTGIRLLSTKPTVIRDTLTDKLGMFTFKNFPPLDTAQFLIQAKNKNDKSFNVGIEVDEFKTPVFKPAAERFMPWYLNSDTTLLRNINTRITQQKILEKLPASENMLQEVTIIGKKVIKDSYNLNGPGEADQTLDEKELQKAGKTTLLQLLEKRIKGFTTGIFPLGTGVSAPKIDELIDSLHDFLPLMGQDKLKAFIIPKFSYKINTSLMRLIIDGIDVDENYTINEVTRYNNEHYLFIKSYLDFYTAEDIKGIEVMSSMQYNSRYSAMLNAREQRLLGINVDYAYIEVTTYSGKGPFMKKTPGTYFYKSMPFVSRKQFYNPAYKTKAGAVQETDLRSTIHWAPNIITDPTGKANVSFYAADRPGTYTVILEGSDLNGSIGYREEKIKINSK